MSQDAIILEHLQRGESVTPLSAFKLCGTLALHSLIARLRKADYDIIKKMRTDNGKRFGEYRLRGQAELAL